MIYTVNTCFRDTTKKAVDIFLMLTFDYVNNTLVFRSVQKLHSEVVVSQGMYTRATWLPAPEFNIWVTEWLVENETNLCNEIKKELGRTPRLKLQKPVDMIGLFLMGVSGMAMTLTSLFIPFFSGMNFQNVPVIAPIITALLGLVLYFYAICRTDFFVKKLYWWKKPT